jgi:hypothetical protein
MAVACKRLHCHLLSVTSHPLAQQKVLGAEVVQSQLYLLHWGPGFSPTETSWRETAEGYFGCFNWAATIDDELAGFNDTQ